MPHIQPDVPKRVYDFLNQALGSLRHPFFEEDQQIHVGVDALGAAPIAAQCDNGVGVAGHVHARTHSAGFEARPEIFIYEHRHIVHEGPRAHAG